jgi:hypothetical protein
MKKGVIRRLTGPNIRKKQNQRYLKSNQNFLFKKAILLFVFLLHLSYLSFSQTTENKKEYRFGTVVTVTNKGISTIPNLTLGKPAVLFDVVIGGERLSFEPTFRFAMEGKPWSFLFWWRYKLVESGKMHFTVGAHPALSFKRINVTKDGVISEDMVVRRYLAGELSPNYSFTKNINIGLYYLYSHGIESDIPQNTNFINLRSTFSNINLTDQYSLRFSPQFYYLNIDKKDGIYYNLILSMSRKNFPLSISALANRAFKTNVTPKKDLLWNVSLVYSFNNRYVKM